MRYLIYDRKADRWYTDHKIWSEDVDKARVFRKLYHAKNAANYIPGENIFIQEVSLIHTGKEWAK